MQGVELDRAWNLSPQAVVLLDQNGIIVCGNTAAAERLGVGDAYRLVGVDYFARLPPALAAERRARMVAVLNPATSEAMPRAVIETAPVSADGTCGLVRCTMVPIGLPAEPPVALDAVLAVFEDAGVAAQGTVGERRSESRFRNAFDQAPYGMALLDMSGRWRRVNRALTLMLGRSADDLMGHSPLSVTHSDDWPAMTAWLDRAVAGDTVPYDGEQRFLKPDGTVLWARMTAALTRGPDGAPLEIVAQVADVTRRHAAEHALRASESRFRETFAAAPHGIAMVSLDGNFLEVNGALCTILGRDERAMLSLDMAAVSHPEDHNVELEAARRLLAGDVRVFTAEKRYLRPEGQVVRARVSLALARDGEGRPHHFIAHVQDVTRQVEAEERLHDAIAAAEQALLAKTRFLAAASHDLRQPLQALNLFVSVLSGRETDPFKCDVLGKIESALGALADLMNTLLDISRLEGGAVLPDQRPFAIGRLVRRLADEFGPVADASGLTFRFVAPSATLYSDPALLEVILRNLIGNALKYTPAGGRVLLGARRQPDGCMLRIDIVDTGAGIPADQRQLIFEDFHQVAGDDGAAGRGAAPARAGGLGLGLGIVSRVARLLGVTVTVESVPGHGSRFSVLVPCHMGGVRPDAVADGPVEMGPVEDDANAGDRVSVTDRWDSLRGRAHLVVVDDDPAIRESLTLLLEGWGHRVSVFAGLSDLTEALLTQTLAHPDVMLVDFRLPSGRTGVEAVALTRGHFREPIPAVLLTGDLDGQHLRDAGRGGLPVLRKPVRPDQLRLRLVDLIGARRRAPDGRTRAPVR
ncbi:PAS domain S-box protein [Roseospira marina]|uniref:histidine kinase n=1 Tax=Roseospira marina TaxID=140057 RepID=A0A5M6IHV7_9PROT|nr:hybrid sensor histidine kinase/response regulator [Roseospira marina]KAA5607399.1 PAS domain S-box protein [Roseospira marina]MBB4312429.1 PAS domain S-box-containing protein [Roseospira marina]MBB5085555.1 PAS domain S-box-containing protein [Roseospira marina]